MKRIYMKKIIIIVLIIFAFLDVSVQANEVSLNDFFEELGFETQQTDECFFAQIYPDTAWCYTAQIDLKNGDFFINNIQQENILSNCKLIDGETYGYLEYFERLFIDNKGDMLVKGYSEFKTAVWKALSNMRKNYPDEYKIVTENLISVSQGSGNWGYLELGICSLTDTIATDSKYLMAALLHEATHINDYKDKKYTTIDEYEHSAFIATHNFLAKLDYDKIDWYDTQYYKKYWRKYGI